MDWRVAEPVLIDRNRRVAWRSKGQPHRFPVPEPWTFLLVHEKSWKVWLTATP